MKHYFNLKHRAFAAACAVASVLSIWYTIGYFMAIAAAKQIWPFESILQWAPQFNLLFMFVSPRAWPINGFDLLGFFIGLLQIYLTAKIITWSIVALYDRMHYRK